MTKQEELKQLQTRKVALIAIMASSDAHAAKCAKLGKEFQTQYPEDYAAYVAANEEYQTVEQRINALEFELSLDEDTTPTETERESPSEATADEGAETE